MTGRPEDFRQVERLERKFALGTYLREREKIAKNACKKSWDDFNRKKV